MDAAAAVTADALRRIYHALHRRVRETLFIPLRADIMDGGVAAVRQDILEFMGVCSEASSPHDRMLPRVEAEILRDSLQRMLAAIDQGADFEQDPPDDVPHPVVHVELGERGRPKIHIDPDILRRSLLARPIRTIAASLGCSARTVRRRALDHNLVEGQLPVFIPGERPGERVRNPHARAAGSSHTVLSNQELDEVVASILTVYPAYGRRLLAGALRTQGMRVQKSRIVASIRRVTGRVRTFRQRVGARRVYRVAGPNSLWHHDGHHGLIRWKIVIHAFIDGYSRFVVAILASNNNRASTVRSIFQAARSSHRVTPHRTRGDCGMENLGVAELMTFLRGEHSYIWGRSVDNTRIERLWVDVVQGVVHKWYNFFVRLEKYDGLDVSLLSHLWLLHHLFLQTINDEILQWADHWNNHPMEIARDRREISATTSETPASLYQWGMVHNGLRGFDLDPDGPLPPPGDEELYDDVPYDELAEYGIDEEAQARRDVRRHHRLNNAGIDEPVHFGPQRPTRFSQVDVSPPLCPIPAHDVDSLDVYLTGHPRLNLESSNMESRRLTWIVALDFMLQLHP